MLNLTMPFLNKLTLPYTGRCLIGVWLMYHHSTSFEVWPLDGYFKFGVVPCGAAKCLKGFLLDDKTSDSSEIWTIINQVRHFDSVDKIDLRYWDFVGIDSITKEHPNVSDPKYWKIAVSYKKFGGRECWWRNHGGLPSNPSYPDPAHPEEGRQGGMPYILCKPVYEKYNEYLPLNYVLQSETPINKSPFNVTIDRDLKLVVHNMPSFGDVYEATTTQIIINFDIDLYKKDHPKLYLIYYIKYKLKNSNNINFTPNKGVKYA